MEKKNTLKLVLLFAGAALLFLLYSSFYQVNAGEIALVTRFEKVVAQHGAGLYFKYPAPVDQLLRFDCRRTLYETNVFEAAARDGTLYTVKAYVLWSIMPEKIETFRQRIGLQRSDAEQKLSLITQNAVRELLGTSTVDSQFETALRERCNQQLNDDFGMTVYACGFTRLEPPSRTLLAMAEQQRSAYEREESVILENAKQQAAQIESEARIAANQQLATARAQAVEIRAKADAEAAQAFSVYKKNPEFAEFLWNLEAVAKSLSEQTTVIIDPSLPFFKILDLAPAPEKATEPAEK